MLYTDPGSGALLGQILAASVVGALFYVRKVFSFFRKSFRTDKPEGFGRPKLDEK